MSGLGTLGETIGRQVEKVPFIGALKQRVVGLWPSRDAQSDAGLEEEWNAKHPDFPFSQVDMSKVYAYLLKRVNTQFFALPGGSKLEQEMWFAENAFLMAEGGSPLSRDVREKFGKTQQVERKHAPAVAIDESRAMLHRQIVQILGVKSIQDVDLRQIPEIPDNPRQFNAETDSLTDFITVVLTDENFMRCMNGTEAAAITVTVENMFMSLLHLNNEGISVSVSGIFALCTEMRKNPAQVIINLGRQARDLAQQGIRFIEVGYDVGTQEHVGTNRGQWLIYKILKLGRTDIEHLVMKPTDLLQQREKEILIRGPFVQVLEPGTMDASAHQSV